MRILVGMSGGVDSTYAAKALLEAGHEVVGAYLVMHEHGDVAAARLAGERLGISVSVIDCRDRFNETVRASFVAEYKKGRTPNPCIICNPLVKFYALAKYARENGFDKIATGHYARVLALSEGGREYHRIAVPMDALKDQSYMLHRLPESILKMLLLPLGEVLKAEVRERIDASGLSELDRPDSQEICFLPDGNYAEYVELVAGKCPEGSFIDSKGNILGKHRGIVRYTIGQRKGLGISLGARAFVTEIDPVKNTVTLEAAPRLSRKLTVTDLHLAIPEGSAAIDGVYDVKIRYAARPARAQIFFDADSAIVIFDEPQRSVTPGQSAVIYKDGCVVGGGFILDCK